MVKCKEQCEKKRRSRPVTRVAVKEDNNVWEVDMAPNNDEEEQEPRWISEEDLLVDGVGNLPTLEPAKESTQWIPEEAPSKYRSGGFTAEFLSDFEKHFGSLSEECRSKLLSEGSGARWAISWRYFADFFLGHVLWGPWLVAFWRGTWDYAALKMDEVYGVSEQNYISFNS